MVKIILDGEEYECEYVTFQGNYMLAHKTNKLEGKVRHVAKVFDLFEVDEIQYF